MRYLTKDDYRVLTAVEMGMRNHEMVPVALITSIAGLRHGGSYKILSTLLRYKLVAHTLQEYDGYRLSYLGYDILALHTLQARGVITSVGNQIGVGKESDIFEALDTENNEVVIKIHRLGRTSFRAVRKTRDYLLNKSKASWLYMSRLAAVKEFTFMKALNAHNFPVPMPIDQNRHVVVMGKVQGFPLAQIKSGKLPNAEGIFALCIDILRRLAKSGLIHCDFNEFNLMINQEGDHITLIDFPQMVSVQHKNASELLERDINCLIKFFAMKMKYVPPDDSLFRLEDILNEDNEPTSIDKEIKASGFDEEDYENVMNMDLFQPLTEVGTNEEDNSSIEQNGDEPEANEPALESELIDVSDLDDNSDSENVGTEEDHGVILEDHTQEKRLADAYSKLRR
jgi:RIO kinase 2